MLLVDFTFYLSIQQVVPDRLVCLPRPGLHDVRRDGGLLDQNGGQIQIKQIRVTGRGRVLVGNRNKEDMSVGGLLNT